MNLTGKKSSKNVRSDKKRRTFIPFLLLSLLFHLILALLYLLFYPMDKQAQQPEKPKFIEITELPVPKDKETEPPKEVKRFAERSHKAPEEKTRDDLTKRRSTRAIPQPRQSKETKTAKEKPKKKEPAGEPRRLASIPKELEKESDLTRKQEKEKKGADLTKEQLFSAAPRQFSQQRQGSEELLGSRDIDKKEDTVDFNTTEFKYISYFNKLKRQIEGVWNYPELSQMRGEQGELFLIFTIRRDGQLEDVKLINSSGYTRLDDEAIRAIRVASPFPPFPNQWAGLEILNVRAAFRYQISYGWMIR